MKYRLYINLIAIITIIISCQEDKIEESGTTNTQDYIIAENIFNDVRIIIHEALINNGEIKSCPQYTTINNDTADLDTIIIDFGDGDPDDCLIYGKERRGKIIITYTGKYRDSLTVISTTFDHYYINNNWIQGKMIITNNGRNNNGNITLSMNIIGGSITGNGTINIDEDKSIEWINGYNSFNNIFDDKYIITGYTNGNSSNGQDFDAHITKDLYIDMSCLTNNTCIITHGELELTPNGHSTRKLNYGDSTCDCNYYIDLNGSEYFIVIN